MFFEIEVDDIGRSYLTNNLLIILDELCLLCIFTCVDMLVQLFLIAWLGRVVASYVHDL